MAEYFVDPTNGNDANAGTSLALAKLTKASAYTAASAGDKVNLRSGLGNHVLAANLTSSKVLYWQTYQPDLAIHGKAVITGNFQITSAANFNYFREIEFQNQSTANAISFQASSAGVTRMTNCDFTMNKSAGSSTTAVINCAGGTISLNNVNITNSGSKNNSAFGSSGGSIICRNVKVNNLNYFAACTSGNPSINIQGCRGYDLLSCLYINAQIALNEGLFAIEYNTFNRLTTAFIINAYTSATTVNNHSSTIRRNYIDAPAAISNTSTSTLIVDQNLNEYNIWSTGASLTNFNSNGDTTTSAPLFYDATNNDYKIEYNSPLANLSGDTVGAFVPAWNEFFDIIPTSKYENGYSAKQGSRTPQLGTLVAGGETDANKVLTTSTIITGNYIPISSAGDVKSGVSFGLSQTGTRTVPSASNVKTGSGTYGAGGTEFTPSYTPDFPSASNVTPDDTVDGVTGTLDLPALNKVAPSDTLRGVAGTMDLPALNRVSPNDTLEGLTGTQDLPLLSNLLTTDTLEGAAGTYTPDFPSVSNVTPDDTVNGQTGTLDLPALNKVAPTDTLRGQAGTMDLPALNRVSPNDTLEGIAGTQDLPSLNSILTTDTLEGAAGTVVLPDDSDVRENVNYGPNNSLEGTAQVSGESTDPGTGNVLKDVAYIINGVAKLGEYDTGHYDEPSANSRKNVIDEIENVLSPLATVSTAAGITEGLIEDDFPFCQVIADVSQYDHRFIAGGNPLVTMKVKLLITSHSSWNQSDCESYLEQIKKTFITENYSLNNRVISTKLESLNPFNTSKKEDNRKQAELVLVFKFIEKLIN